MATEIERKFLVANDSWRAAVIRSERMTQGYIARGPTATVRIRLIDGDDAMLTLKGKTVGVSRPEFEYAIPRDEAEDLLVLCGEARLSKTRHFIEHVGHEWTIDVFEDRLSGLIVAEIELGDEAESFATPSWLGEEVSQDKRYANALLVDATAPPIRN
ncbi:CYTH domain-containing protein [Devosia sp.]|uniref:CYTH domain-containing protein n=1 Tax=Devosia sp. TaxID=1871048 RepID=UPI003A947C49